MRLLSKLPGGGYSPDAGLEIPPEGTTFEVDEDRGARLVAAGLAELAPEAVRPPPPRLRARGEAEKPEKEG